MKTPKKFYNSAFKIRAVELSNERSNVAELARELEILFAKLIHGFPVEFF